MSHPPCPTEADLLRFVDGELSREQLERISLHGASCQTCARRIAALRELLSDLGAPPPGPPLDVAEHVAQVMARLDDAPRRQAAAPRWVAWGGLLAAAAAVLLFVLRPSEDTSQMEFAARGGAAERSTSRDIGLQLYGIDTGVPAPSPAQLRSPFVPPQEGPRPLRPGSSIRSDVALTAGLRNLGSEPVYLLLFAIDARHDVHWISPEYSNPDADPESTRVLPSTNERLLPSAAQFDDLAPGPLRVVALLTREPRRVSAIERLSPEELGGDRWLQRFPEAELRQFRLDVTP